MNKEQILKRIKLAKVKHETQRRAYLIKNKYDIGEFRGLELPYKPRLGTFKSSSGKVEFNPSTMIATSYTHWTFVKKVNGKLLFNNASYSMTTNRHQSQVRTLLSQLSIKYTTINMPNNGDLDNLSNETTLRKYEEMIDFEIEVFNTTKGRLKTGAHQNRLWNINNLKKEIKVLESIGFKVTKKEVTKLRKSMFKKDAERIAKAKQEKADQKAFLKNQFETNEAFNLNLGA